MFATKLLVLMILIPVAVLLLHNVPLGTPVLVADVLLDVLQPRVVLMVVLVVATATV
jgi:hypothetical protein